MPSTASLAVGVVGMIPSVLAGDAVEQLLPAPLDQAQVDPTNHDGTGVLVVCGVVAPLLVVAGWDALTTTVVRRCSLGRRGLSCRRPITREPVQRGPRESFGSVVVRELWICAADGRANPDD